MHDGLNGTNGHHRQSRDSISIDADAEQWFRLDPGPGVTVGQEVVTQPEVDRPRSWSLGEEESQTTAPCVVEDLLELGEVSITFGDSSVGKSFWQVDLCVHVALGHPFYGRETLQGGTLYYQFEGRGSFGKRLRAATSHLSPDEVDDVRKNLRVAQDPPSVNPKNLEPAKQQIAADMADYKERFGAYPKLVVIDTLTDSLGRSQRQ